MRPLFKGRLKVSMQRSDNDYGRIREAVDLNRITLSQLSSACVAWDLFFEMNILHMEERSLNAANASFSFAKV